MSLFEMFQPSPADLDTQIEAAGLLVKQACDEQGVDIDNLSDAEVQGMLLTVMGKTAGDEAAAEVAEAPEGEDVTVADVALEVSKRAAAEGFDLSSLSREQYDVVFQKVASEMTDPEAREKAAAEQAATAQYEGAKLAMQEFGELAADAFVERLNKLAEEDETPKGKADDKDKKPKKEDEDDEKLASAKEKVLGKLKNLGASASSGAKKLPGKADKGVQRVGEKTMNVIGAGAEKAHPKTKRIAGGAALATGGAAGAGGALALKRHKEKKAEIEEEALKVARQTLLDNGIDPDTGAKLASSEVLDRAAEMLREAGYEL